MLVAGVEAKLAEDKSLELKAMEAEYEYEAGDKDFAPVHLFDTSTKSLTKFAQSDCVEVQGATLEVVEGAGHWLQQEQPALVNAGLVAFLDGLADL